jgi:hypothetical protein
MMMHAENLSRRFAAGGGGLLTIRVVVAARGLNFETNKKIEK